LNPLKIPRVKPGDAIEAGHFNRLAEAAEAAQLVLGQGSNLEGAPGPGGTHVRALLPKVIWAKLTNKSIAVDGGYDWLEQIPDPGTPGDWRDGNMQGGIDDKNLAFNTVDGVTIDVENDPPIVRLTLASDDTWRFTFGDCD
jgi:hypothetical protein